LLAKHLISHQWGGDLRQARQDLTKDDWWINDGSARYSVKARFMWKKARLAKPDRKEDRFDGQGPCPSGARSPTTPVPLSTTAKLDYFSPRGSKKFQSVVTDNGRGMIPAQWLPPWLGPGERKSQEFHAKIFQGQSLRRGKQI